MSYRIALLAAAGTLALSAASAQDDEKGYYGAAGLGYAYGIGNNDFQSDEADTTAFTNIRSFDSALDTNGGLATYGAIGKYFDWNLRGEVELSYRLTDIETLPGERRAADADVQGDGEFFVGFLSNGDIGNMSAISTMVNVYRDFEITEKLTPYAGFGVGVTQLRFDFDNVDDVPAATNTAQAGTTGYRVFMKNADYVPAFQIRGGASYAITDDLSFDIGYRYLQTGRYDTEAFINNEVTDVTGDYRVHETTFGLRYAFGAKGGAYLPRPAATNAAPEVQTKTCFDGTVVPMGQDCPTVDEDALTPEELRTVVYFDLDSAVLTPAARTLLQNRAAQAAEVDLIEVIVSGNTDTTGSADYNRRLSARRAEVVRQALVGFGVDQSKIRVRALGETNLARQTPDGVKEPLNRRSEVEFRF
ncbi:MAG: OmpA family protein [Pseudomonadota bacterium]